jgi:hypothetical protein
VAMAMAFSICEKYFDEKKSNSLSHLVFLVVKFCRLFLINLLQGARGGKKALIPTISMDGPECELMIVQLKI